MNKLKEILNYLKSFYQINGKAYFKADLIAGITVALVIIPQAMAYAGLAGLSIEIGLYTAFIGTLIGGFLGSSKQMSTGPVTIVSLMTAAAIGTIGIESTEQYVAYASLLAFFIGIFYLLLVSLRLGVIVEFISHPVIIGFTNAIALVTIISQTPKIFGINIQGGLDFFTNAKFIIITALNETHILTFLFGFLGIVLLLWLKIFYQKLPRVLILLIVSIIASYLIGYKELFGGKVVGNIPEGLPNFSLDFLGYITNTDNIFTIIAFAFIIGLIGFTESISVAKGVAATTKQKVSTNKELLSQGFANIGASLFGAYGVAGSFSRTAVNLRAGAKTGLASIITGLIVGLTLIYLTPLLYHLPMATLAAIIIVAVGSLIRIEPIIESWQIQKSDGITAIITFLLTIIFTPNVEKGILAGVTLSLGLYIYRSMRPKIVEVSMYKGGVLRDAKTFNLRTSKDVSIIRVDGNLFFANISFFESKVIDMISEKEDLKILIFDFEWMSNIDSSAYIILSDLTQKLEKSGVKVYLSNIRLKVLHKLDNVGYLKKISKKRIFHNTEDIIKFLKKKYKKNEVNVKVLLEYSPKDKDSKVSKILDKIN